jgi:acetylornithine deacetylase/succinyl-diaminopimelate desuccinylase-like protein
MAWYRVTWLSDAPAFYTPYLPDRAAPEESPNMIVRAALGVAVLERWAAAYQRRYAYESPDGPVIPKAQVCAIRGGDETRAVMTPQVCRVSVGAFTVPGQDPLALRAEIADALRAAGVPATEVELYLFRRGYQARGTERLRAALVGAHEATFGTPPPPPNPATCSMWRDINVWSEAGIPALTYGPRASTHSYRRAFPIDALYRAAQVYARLIVDLCSPEKVGVGR